MRAVFERSAGVAINHCDFSRASGAAKREGRGRNRAGDERPFVQLKIDANVLRRLIVESRLFAEELHCLDAQSSATVRQALLESLLATRR